MLYSEVIFQLKGHFTGEPRSASSPQVLLLHLFLWYTCRLHITTNHVLTLTIQNIF